MSNVKTTRAMTFSTPTALDAFLILYQGRVQALTLLPDRNILAVIEAYHADPQPEEENVKTVTSEVVSADGRNKKVRK